MRAEPALYSRDYRENDQETDCLRDSSIAAARIRSIAEVTLRLFHLPEKVTINIFDLNGNLVKRCHQHEGVSEFFAGPGVKETRFNISTGQLSQGLHFVQITDQKSGDIKTLKWMVL